jgi:hypothetical protein
MPEQQSQDLTAGIAAGPGNGHGSHDSHTCMTMHNLAN